MALKVGRVDDLSPTWRRITLTGESLIGFQYAPGQDVMLVLPAADGTMVRRRYSIRRADPLAGTLEINIVRHGNGPGARWATQVQPGQELGEAVAPRGKITVIRTASWHLFAGDETAVPAMLNMAESIEPLVPMRLVFEVDTAGDQTDVSPPMSGAVRWVYRTGERLGQGHRLLAALADFPIPDGHGHAYLAGEATLVLAQRDLLVARGMPRDALSVKAYWRADQANRERGEPQPLE